jgi:hypothetical protein
MFCPRCGSSHSEELKFCKTCGTNLSTVRQAVEGPDTGENFDWGKTWVAEMFLSEAEQRKRRKLLDAEAGLTPEVKRVNEIKAGVITSSAGVGSAVVVFFIMQGIILSGNVTPETAEILSRLWIAGILPLLIGLALIVNGLIVSKRLVEIAKSTQTDDSNKLEADHEPRLLRSPDTNEFIPANLSVTDQTTRHLEPKR